MKIFSIYDEKAEAFLQPFFMETVGQAERALIDCLSDENHNFSRHSADYTLFQIGEFDQTTAEITPLKIGLSNLVELKPKLNNLHSITGNLEVGGTD